MNRQSKSTEIETVFDFKKTPKEFDFGS